MRACGCTSSNAIRNSRVSSESSESLRGLAPLNLLDIGSGRGTFLWPLMAAFPDLQVTAVDVSERRSCDIAAVRRGGIERLNVIRMDAQWPALAAGIFDVITMLGTLEHIVDPQQALNGLVAVARRFIVLTVPSAPDENPEHLHLFAPEQLHTMAKKAGVARTTIEHVLNHRIVVMRVGQ